ncbi:MAG: hypothetical protein A3G77_12505 [Acidobacteria bacterium RIFCSPLOWO2_12_FULL_68_19]|nr:MAG: hypothetical protein A3G77_12505 [Acidobacteria bacterium RIFCSPLOWO2_12_FULL_68_19]
MGILPNTGGAAVRFRLLDAQARQARLELRHPRRSRGLPLARLRQPGARRLDRSRQLAAAPRQQHLLPPPQLVAQAPVALRLGGLPLQRTALLLHLEDDVVDAREVLLGRLQLQLGGAAPRPVLGDAGGLLNELPPIDRPRAEDQTDLSLLDDGVGLGAETGVHHQLVDVAQPADLSVDQVFAFTRPVEPARHLDVAREQLRSRLMAIPVAVAIAVAIAVPVRRRRMELDELAIPVLRLGESGEAEPDFGGGAWLARLAAAEDHVLHPVAAQALGALLAEHPRNGIRHVALPAPIGPDDGGDAVVEGEFRAVGERLEAVDLETLQAHVGYLQTERRETLSLNKA